MTRVVQTSLCSIFIGLATAAAQAAAASGDSSPDCWVGVVPGGALPTQPPPVFCDIVSSPAGTDTAVIGGANTWFDGFNHGLFFRDWDDTSYSVFETVDGVAQSIHWRHADHWMVDIAPVEPGSDFTALGGAMLRPNATFEFDDGPDGNPQFVVETEMAAGHQDYIGLQAWGEIVVTTAPAPIGYRTGGTYAYDMFPGHYTLGLRLQADRHAIASLMNDSDDTVNSIDARLWEMSFFQLVGSESFGGFPGGELADVWRTCHSENDADTACRDRFRLTLTETSLRLDVNGVRYFEQIGIPPLPSELLDGPIYVYLASIVGTTDHDVVRYHWDRFRVNPCAADVDGDFAVSFSDVVSILNSWGDCITCANDLDGNRAVDIADLLRALAAWGGC